jgi:hypothetical protein
MKIKLKPIEIHIGFAYLDPLATTCFGFCNQSHFSNF